MRAETSVRDEAVLRPVRRGLHEGLRATLVAAIALGVFAVVVFDWSAGATAVSAAVGVVCWGSMYHLIQIRPIMRATRDLRRAPENAVVGSATGHRVWLWLLLLSPLFVATAWLADAFEMGGLFVPGQLLGAVAADAIGAAFVGRWERRHGALLVRSDRDGKLYARPRAAVPA